MKSRGALLVEFLSERFTIAAAENGKRLLSVVGESRGLAGFEVENDYFG
jgi:hypothetical protein